MSAAALAPAPDALAGLAPATRAALETVATRLRQGSLAAYLGPGVLAAGQAQSGGTLPADPKTLAMALHKRFPVHGKIKGNLWSTAQYIESNRHRVTLEKGLKEIFAAKSLPTPLHRALATLRPALIIDSWYDGAMAAALAALPEQAGWRWGQVQGANRQKIGAAAFTAAYDGSGARVEDAAPATWETVLYCPHGSLWPEANLLVSDSDYVEALTEIDLQTPIPPVVQARRQACGFLFLGCRFDDQMLRTYAKQIAKRSGGGHVAVLADAQAPTENERRFLEQEGATVIDLDTATAAEALAALLG